MPLFSRLLCAALVLTAYSARAATPPPTLADLVSRVMPSVVSIASTDPIPANDSGSNSGNAYHPANATPADSTGTVIPPPKSIEALGSGFVFDPAGYILTNNHVINGAASVTVTFQDGTILPAIIVGRDKAVDLAVLKVDAGHPLPFLTFGDSGKLRVGDSVVAIGNPFGLPGSTTSGIVSALNRNIHSGNYDDFIQTDAAINSGNSGGPLLNMDGQVIGVDSEIYSPSGGSIGLGFAIPSAMIAPVAQALKTTGVMLHGWLGAATEEVTPAIQKSLGLPGTSGALVGGVSTGSPSAGKLQPGDVIVSLAGVNVKDPRALLVRTAEIPSGSQVLVSFWRNGALHQASLLITVPPPALDNTIPTPAPRAPGNLNLPGLGLSVSVAPGDGGVTVTSANGPAAQAGIVAGDLIEQVSGQAVTTAADLRDKVAQLASAHTPVAVFLISGDATDGTNPGTRWVPVTFKGK